MIDVVPLRATKAAMAVFHGARTVRAVATACGWKSTNTAHEALRLARRYGLVRWEDGDTTVRRRSGTLRPGVAFVVWEAPDA